MTIIVGYKTKKGLLFASDTECSSPSEKGTDTIAKVFEKNGIVYAVSGSINLNNELRYNFNYKILNWETNYFETELFTDYRNALKDFIKNADNCLTEQNEVDGQILIGAKGNLYVIQNDLSMTNVMKNYYCIGCGSSHALGSLYTTHSLIKIPVKKKLQLAIEAAGEFSMGCNKEVKFYDYTNRPTK